MFTWLSCVKVPLPAIVSETGIFNCVAKFLRSSFALEYLTPPPLIIRGFFDDLIVLTASSICFLSALGRGMK